MEYKNSLPSDLPFPNCE